MPLELQIREFPDECVFLNKEYCVKIFAMDSKKTLHTHPVPLQLAMFYANGVEIEPGTIADVSPIEMSDESKMCATVKITFKKPSVLFKNEKVYFVVRPAVSSDGLDVDVPTVKSTSSHRVLVVRRRLVVTTKLPEKWYKDQGGREKHMAVALEMRDGDDKLVRPTAPIPLTIKVGYEHSDELADSRVLLLMGDPVQRPEIGKNGRGTIRFRIQEVSSGHRRQKFCLVVEPDIVKAPLNADIAGARSTGVDVRSKMPAKCKRKLLANSSPHDSRGTNNPVSSTARGMLGGDPKRERRAERPTLNGSELGATLTSTLNQVPTGTGFGPTGSNSAQAVWMEASLKVLRAMEWQMIGYGIQANGEMNYNERIYRCPSCYKCQQPHTADCPLHIAISHYERIFGQSGDNSTGGLTAYLHNATGDTPAALLSIGRRTDITGLPSLGRLPSTGWSTNPQVLFNPADENTSPKRAATPKRENWMPNDSDSGFQTVGTNNSTARGNKSQQSSRVVRNHSLGVNIDGDAHSDAHFAHAAIPRNTSISTFESQNGPASTHEIDAGHEQYLDLERHDMSRASSISNLTSLQYS